MVGRNAPMQPPFMLFSIAQFPPAGVPIRCRETVRHAGRWFLSLFWFPNGVWACLNLALKTSCVNHLFTGGKGPVVL